MTYPSTYPKIAAALIRLMLKAEGWEELEQVGLALVNAERLADEEREAVISSAVRTPDPLEQFAADIQEMATQAVDAKLQS